jgi:hypothetical protein
MSTKTGTIGELFFLLHSGDVQFSGYGLTVEPGRHSQLVGLLMIDRSQPASAAWLATVKQTFGQYTLHPMTTTGERGIVCQMWIAEDSLVHVRQLPGSFTRALQAALFPLLSLLPAPQFDLFWDGEVQLWRSQLHAQTSKSRATGHPAQQDIPRFSLGSVVATPGALAALEEAGQLPQEFLHRHLRGDWGELDVHDRQANERAVREGNRILSAYRTRLGVKLYVITEWDRSYTTLLLPQDY